jgi:hypothetical protein
MNKDLAMEIGGDVLECCEEFERSEYTPYDISFSIKTPYGDFRITIEPHKEDDDILETLSCFGS